jgi:hypothetical protein
MVSAEGGGYATREFCIAFGLKCVRPFIKTTTGTIRALAVYCMAMGAELMLSARVRAFNQRSEVRLLQSK